MSKWVAPSSRSRKHGVYHTNKKCCNLKREPIEMSDRDVEILELSLCKVCDPENTNQHEDNGKWEYYEIAKNAEL